MSNSPNDENGLPPDPDDPGPPVHQPGPDPDDPGAGATGSSTFNLLKDGIYEETNFWKDFPTINKPVTRDKDRTSEEP